MKMTRGQKIFNVFNIILILLFCVITIYPYLNQLAISFNEGTDTTMGGITVYPREFTLDNYVTVFQNQRILQASVISVLRVILGTVLPLFVTFSAAYALTRSGLKWRKALTWYLCIPMYVTAGIIPTYILYRYLGLINNFLVYILPFAFSFYNMVILRSFLQEVPKSLEESALIDGANEMQVMFKIMVPMAMPALATVTLWLAVGQWNDWSSTLMYITKPNLYPLQYIMMQIIKESEVAQQLALNASMTGQMKTPTSTPESVQSAVLIVTTIPIIMVYPFLQKYFIKGVVLGAVKE